VRLVVLAAAALAPFSFPECDRGPRGLSHDQIEATIKERGEGLKSCWKPNGTHGELKLRVAIVTSAEGKVESATAEGKPTAVTACLEKQIRGWTFARVEGQTKFSLPVNLKR
jgi:hypothetical protein